MSDITPRAVRNSINSLRRYGYSFKRSSIQNELVDLFRGDRDIDDLFELETAQGSNLTRITPKTERIYNEYIEFLIKLLDIVDM